MIAEQNTRRQLCLKNSAAAACVLMAKRFLSTVAVFSALAIIFLMKSIKIKKIEEIIEIERLQLAKGK